jgi:two-component system, OmpR family, response regulator
MGTNATLMGNTKDDIPEVPLRVLVIEDDAHIGRLIENGFIGAGHHCDWAKTGTRGLEEALSQQFDVILLDMMLPEINGLEVLRSLRAGGVRTPLLILTALGSVDDKVAGLRAGADDYIVKPFAFSELFARVDAVCRRSGQRPSPNLQAGAISLDLTNRRVTAQGRHIDLTPTEFTILELLMRNAGQVTTRKALCEHVWEDDWDGVTNVIEVHINRLRNKLGQTGLDGLIQTVRGRGYSLRAGE